MTDKQKGWLLMCIGAFGNLTVWLITRKLVSFAYGIFGISLFCGSILLSTTIKERTARPFFKALGIILIVLFLTITIIGTLMEFKLWIR